MKFLIVDRMYDSLSPMLKEIGIEADYQPLITRERIMAVISEFDGLVIRSKTFVDEALLENADKLKYICRAGAGIDNLDIEAIDSRHIKMINAPEGNRNALAEHTLGLLLSLLNNIVKSDKEVRKSIWDREGNRGVELAGKTVGIVGYGHMGKTFAQKLSHLGCEILIYDKYKSNFANQNIKEASLERLFEETDILSIHVPLTSETHNMFDADFFSNFRKPIRLINTSRGEVLPLRDLVTMIESEKIIGVALDVLENEKINTFAASEQENFNYLINSDRVILTPHVGGWSFESYEMINQVLVDKLRKSIG